MEQIIYRQLVLKRRSPIQLLAVYGDGTILQKLPGFTLGTGKGCLRQKIDQQYPITEGVHRMG